MTPDEFGLMALVTAATFFGILAIRSVMYRLMGRELD